MAANGAQTTSAAYFQRSSGISSGPLAQLLLRRWRASLTSRSVMGYESGLLGCLLWLVLDLLSDSFVTEPLGKSSNF